MEASASSWGGVKRPWWSKIKFSARSSMRFLDCHSIFGFGLKEVGGGGRAGICLAVEDQ